MTHDYADERMVSYLNEERLWDYPRKVPYHPRSDTHGRAQCRYFLKDLLYESDELSERAASGELVFAENHKVGNGGLGWNTDLVLGPGSSTEKTDMIIDRGEPDDIWLALDAKSIMTEHQKARRNRVRDLNSFADIMHHHNEKAISAGIVLVNSAETFDSPTRDPSDITEHNNIDRIVDNIIEMFEAIDKSDGTVSNNLDAASCIVVDHTNNPSDTTSLQSVSPSSEVSYNNFVTQTASLIEDRFCKKGFFKRLLS